MKARSFLILALSVVMIFSLSVAACTKQVIADITPQVASKLIAENRDDPDFIIIDVRTPEEFAAGHIENAINIDFRSEGFEDSINELDKNKTYLVYCRTANRSRSAVNIMEELDFNEIYHMLGGIVQWEAEGLPIAK